jgi:hypothetical protein
VIFRAPREIAELRREMAELRAFVETRARAQENLMRALLADAAPRAAEALEPRIKLATREAMGFAEQGLQQHEAALRALGRRVAELGRAAPPAEASLAAPAAAASYYVGLAGADTRGCLRLDAEENLANLPVLPGGAARLVASHVVEHLLEETLAREILPHWRSRLAPGGELLVVTRDGPAFAADLARSGGDFAEFRRKLGAARPPRHLYAAEELRDLLARAGLEPQAPATGPDFTLRVAARAPAA